MDLLISSRNLKRTSFCSLPVANLQREVMRTHSHSLRFAHAVQERIQVGVI